MENLDHRTVSGFGFEWKTFDQSKVSVEESERLFKAISHFSVDKLPLHAVGIRRRLQAADVGPAKWSQGGAPALYRRERRGVIGARRNLGEIKNCELSFGQRNNMPIDDSRLGFLVLVRRAASRADTAAAIGSCVQKLKMGAPFLIYLITPSITVRMVPAHLGIDQSPAQVHFHGAPIQSVLPLRKIIAATLYYPLARISGWPRWWLERGWHTAVVLSNKKLLYDAHRCFGSFWHVARAAIHRQPNQSHDGAARASVT